MYRYLNRIFLVFVSVVSVIGLISCAKPKPATEMIVKDEWIPNAPHVEWTENEIARSTSLQKTKELNLPVNGRIVARDSSIVSMSVTSKCRTERGVEVVDTDTDKGVLELRSLLPDTAWQSFNLNDKKLDCALYFDLRNRNQSHWKFTIQQIYFEHFERLENGLNVKNLTGDRAMAGKFALLCEHFRTSWSADQPITIKDALLFATARSESDTEALQYGQQNCRLATEVDAKGEVGPSLTPVFKHQFPAPKVELNAIMDLSESIVANIEAGSPVLKVAIKNLSKIRVAYRLYDTSRENLAIQHVVVRDSDKYSTEDEYLTSLNYKVAGASTFEIGTDRIIEIAPGSTATITATIESPRKCYEEPELFSQQLVRQSLLQKDLTHVGYTYSFPKKRFLARYVNWSENRLDPLAKLEDTGLFDAAQPNKNNVYSGWAPSKGWLAQVGPARVEDIVYKGNPHSLPCRVISPNAPKPSAMTNGTVRASEPWITR